MRRGLAWLAAVVGTLVALVGLTVAVVVGPDDTVSRSPHGLPVAGAKATMAYSSWPDLFPYRDLTLVVTARGGGSVFVGTANPVDAESYADGVRAYRFSEVSGSGRITGGRASGDTGARPSVAPTKAAFWVDKTSGTREARLRVPLDGTPLSVVALAERGPLSLGFGVRLAGLFWTAVAVLLVGLALLAYAVWRLRRKPGDDATAVRAGGVTAGGVALLLLASGCGWVPQAVEPVRPTKIPMTTSQLQGVLDDYDRRNNAAIKASQTRFDGSLWAKADGGSVLASDEFNTDYARAIGKKSKGVVLEHRASRLYAPTDHSFPLSVIVTSELAASGATAKERAAEKYVATYLMSQACATCPWLVTASAAMPRSRQPTPLPVGARSTPNPAQKQAATQFRSSLTRYLRTGRSSRVRPAGGLGKFRDEYTKSQSFETVDLRVSPYDDGGTHLVRVRGGALAIFEHAFTWISTAKPDSSVYWKEKAFAKVLNQEGSLAMLTEGGVLTTTVLLPDKGKAAVLDASWSITGP